MACRRVAERRGRHSHAVCGNEDWAVHEALTSFTMVSYNFCWPVRTLRVQVAEHQYVQRTPGLVGGLTDHIGTINEWVSSPAVTRLPAC